MPGTAWAVATCICDGWSSSPLAPRPQDGDRPVTRPARRESMRDRQRIAAAIVIAALFAALLYGSLGIYEVVHDSSAANSHL